MYPSYNLKNTNISLQATIERSSPHYVDLLVDWVGGLLRKRTTQTPCWKWVTNHRIWHKLAIEIPKHNLMKHFLEGVFIFLISMQLWFHKIFLKNSNNLKIKKNSLGEIKVVQLKKYFNYCQLNQHVANYFSQFYTDCT